MNKWMKRLADHYQHMRNKYPDDDLIIVFDIDGTILDTRKALLFILQAYDRAHETDYFKGWTIEDITVHEAEADKLLEDLEISPEEKEKIIQWGIDRYWTTEIILASHRPFQGVLEVIRWFQIQPKTFVGLNTARGEYLRDDTLRSLNELAKEYRVEFTNELLYMNQFDGQGKALSEKAAGIHYFKELGYRVVSMIDNEPANLRSVADNVKDEDILLLHADTLFMSERSNRPLQAVSGRSYDLTEFITEDSLPTHIQFVWDGVTASNKLEPFFESNITWIELDVRRDPVTEQLIIRDEDFSSKPLYSNEELMMLKTVLPEIKQNNRCVQLDLKGNEEVVAEVLHLLSSSSFKDEELWFNANIEQIGENAFKSIKKACPNANIQCPIDFLAPLITSMPEKAYEIIDVLTEWGINRFSINWGIKDKARFIQQMDDWDFKVNLSNVNNLSQFLSAVVLLPSSITSTFDNPKWSYYRKDQFDYRQWEYYGRGMANN